MKLSCTSELVASLSVATATSGSLLAGTTSEGRVGFLDSVGAVQLQLGGEPGQDVVVGVDLDARLARVGARPPDLHVNDAILSAGVEDGVEDLGQDQRVDDVTLDFEDLG